MPNEFKKIFLFSAFYILVTSPSYGDGYWDYYGSGREHPYSAYIDRANYIGPADYATFQLDYVDPASYVPQPMQVSAAPAIQPAEFTVNIPNKHGGYTTVVIKRSGSGFVGPQGEYYTEFPPVFQLELMYGK